jgi:hypothetical protein
MNSPVYVCPVDLNAAHDRYVKRKQRKIEEDRRRREREAIAALERKKKEFYEQKKVFFGLQFSTKDILVKVLESIEEYEQEGKALGHCIFTNAYYGKSDTLCLSARRKGKPVESIEISLKTYQIIQSHGLRNQNSRYHTKIVKLVESNINKIKQAHKIAI